MFNKRSSMSDRAVVGAKQVGDSLKVLMPTAETLLAAGAKLGALKTGARIAGLFVRRHPAVTVATVAGAGVLWYAAKRRSARAEKGNDTGNGAGKSAIEGRSKRVDARNGDETSTTRKATSTSTARKRTSSARGSRGSRSAGSESASTAH